MIYEHVKISDNLHGKVRKSEPKICTKVKRMVSSHLEQKIREKHVSTRDRLGENRPICLFNFRQVSSTSQTGQSRHLPFVWGVQPLSWPMPTQPANRVRHGSP